MTLSPDHSEPDEAPTAFNSNIPLDQSVLLEQGLIGWYVSDYTGNRRWYLTYSRALDDLLSRWQKIIDNLPEDKPNE